MLLRSEPLEGVTFETDRRTYYPTISNEMYHALLGNAVNRSDFFRQIRLSLRGSAALLESPPIPEGSDELLCRNSIDDANLRSVPRRSEQPNRRGALKREGEREGERKRVCESVQK